MKSLIVILSLMMMGAMTRADVLAVGSITVKIPANFRPVQLHTKDSLGDLEDNLWQADGGRKLELIYYSNFPKQDRGPMIIAKDEEIEIAGQKTKLIETKMFFGAEKKVLVVYLNFGDSIYIIDSENVPKSEFVAVLKSIEHREKQTQKMP